MSCNNNQNDNCDNNLSNIDDFSDLECNIGRIITVFTQSGGCTGCGFTGLLVESNCKFIKLITNLPSAPRHPFGMESGNCCCERGRGFGNGFGFGGRNEGCCGTRFGTVIVIPINKIVSFVFNQV